MDLTEFGIITVVNDVHPAKQTFLIDITESGIVMDDNDSQN
jgi:hypothetical protein